MAEFVSSFITGFKEVVQQDLKENYKGIKIISIFDGLVHYKFDGDSHILSKILYFNNTFFVLKTCSGKGANFPSLVNSVCTGKNYFLVNKGSFRIRFINENQFAKVDKNLTRRAEDYVLRNSKLKLDRLSPSTEIWFCLRREGFGFCGQLISHREFTEKNLNKGELRPEIAYLMCCFSGIREMIKTAQNEPFFAADPFCGYGAIPLQLKKHFSKVTVFASDIDKEKIELLKGRELEAIQNDAFVLDYIQDKSLDAIITDPPWGLWENIPDIQNFYEKMFESFKRILKENGSMTILSARTQELENAAKNKSVHIEKSLHTLVNGKKASLYLLTYL